MCVCACVCAWYILYTTFILYVCEWVSEIAAQAHSAYTEISKLPPIQNIKAVLALCSPLNLFFSAKFYLEYHKQGKWSLNTKTQDT